MKLRPRMTFDSFCAGESNQLAYMFTRFYADLPGPSYFLFIHGNRCLGKTHLLMALGNEIIALSEKANVVAYDAAAVVERLAVTVRQKKREEFLLALQKVDVLLLDNVHVLSGKHRIQEDLVRVLDGLRYRLKWVAFTATRHPHGILNLRADFRAWLEKGLVVSMNRPGMDEYCPGVCCRTPGNLLRCPKRSLGRSARDA